MRYFCICTALVLMFSTAVHAQWGNLSGQFIYDGKAPTPDPLKVIKDAQFCGKHNLISEEITVNADNGGLANVVLYLYLAPGKKAPKAHPKYAETANAKVVLDNENCRFTPHVTLLRTTQTLVVGNKDPLGHNTKIDAIKNVPINPIVPAGGSIEATFDQAERLPVTVSCSIHPWMTARVVVKDNPYMAVSDKDGKFKIENVPTGSWTFQAWHEACGYVKEVRMGGKKTTWSKGRFTRKVASGENDLGKLLVSPSLLKRS